MKRLSILLLSMLCTAATAFAYDFQSGDLYYNITGENTVEVTYQNYHSWNNYKGLTTAIIPETITYDGITYSVKGIGDDAFYWCHTLNSITIPNSVISIGEGAFCDCYSLVTLSIPESVTNIGIAAFLGCNELTSITMGHSVTSIRERVFYGCTSLTSITIPDSVTSIGEEAFRYCSALTSIDLPKSITSIGNVAFNDCSSLTSITIPESVTSIGNSVFDGCSALTSIVVESGNTMYDSRENCNAIIETATNILTVGCQSTTIPNSVTSIGDYALVNCSSLTSITIPESVTSIGEYAFYVCSSLTSITIPIHVTNIENNLFYNCSSLTSLTIPESVTNIGDEAFMGCSSLTSLTIPNSVTNIGKKTFNGCSSLTSLTIPNSVTNIGEEAFCWCSTLTSITIPNSVTSIGDFTFDGCSSLSSVTIGNSVTSIGRYAFRNCSSLTFMTIGNSVITIRESAFYNCSSLDSITCKAITPPTCSSNSFYGVSSAAIVWIPCYGYEAYSNQTPWSSFNLKLLLPTLQTQSSDSIMGRAQIDQDIDCDSIAIISATANYGHHFTQWSDGDTNNPRTIKVTQDTTLTAEFAPNQYTLTTSANYAERGTIQGDTVADYLSNVQISATANYGYHFTQWSDGNTDNPRTILLTKDTNVVALFDKNQYTVTTSCNTEQGSVSKPQTAEYLDEISISATANYGYHFTQWSDGDTNNPRTIKVTKDTTLTAEFAPNQYTLTTSANYAERGTIQGDTVADYLSNVQISATANYGYHFTQWNDGNTDNPRTILLTKDTNVVALFDKNQYTITTYCNAEQGSILGMQVAEYLDEVMLTVLPNVGWRFTQWSDGNTDNPRTFILTQDTAFSAEFTMDYSGKCGDNLYWTYGNKELKISGKGAMYNYTDSTMPWKLLRDSIMTIRVDSSATSIGEYAFANTPKLAELHIGANVETVGANAFLGCNRLYHIYCYPTYPPLTVESSFANYNVYLHIPCESKEDYTLDLVWGLFKHIECLDSEMGIEDTQVPIGNQTLRKVLRDGQVIIIRNGETYDMMGQRLQ